MALPLHSRFRRELKNSFNKLLSLLFPTKAKREIIPSGEIHRILIIRINYRIGNILFITPLLRALEQRFPKAEIDVLIGAKYPSSLLRGSTAVKNVYDFPRKLLKNPINLFHYIKQLRAPRYDLVVSPNRSSASDKGATFLARSRYKLGFNSVGNWSPSTHIVDFPTASIHEALKPLYLMQAFGDKPSDYPQILDIALSENEKKQGLEMLKGRLLEQGYVWEDKNKIIGIFRDARFEKKIDNEWWMECHREMKQLNPNAIFIDILSPDVPEKLSDEFYTLMESNLRNLGAMLSQMDAFICGDTGPMHLASASGVATIALFKTTSPTLYGTLGANDRSLTLSGLTTQAIALQISNHLANITKTV